MSLGKSATPLGKVAGLGSAKHGGGHWLEERFTSIAMLLLSLWLVFEARRALRRLIDRLNPPRTPAA